jgi:CPA1 family monovalent cation:H+ antiporter
VEEHTIEIGVAVVGALLAVAVAASILLSKLKVPYTIGLVVVGGICALLSRHFNVLEPVSGLTLSPGIILFLVLPTLIFDAALNIEIKRLRRDILPILALAAAGLIISAAVIGGTLPLLTALPLSGALLFGALISATDPVAVISLFNEIKAPKRLIVLIDGESIFNDATAIVLFSIFLAAPINGMADILHKSAPALVSFVTVLCGGAAIGALTGFFGMLVLRFRKGDMTLQITVTLITAYASFLLADKLGGSGVISTLLAGLVLNATMDATVRRRHRETLRHFWEYFAFAANSFVFLLLGFTEFKIFHTSESIKHSVGMILLAIPIIIAARAAAIYAIVPIYNKFVKRENGISFPYQTILLWGGLRGAVPVALVFSIPESYPHRTDILHLTFGYILFTLLINGTTIKKLMNALGMSPEKNALDGLPDVVSATYPLESHSLAKLVARRILDIASEEGFFVSKDEKEGDDDLFTLKKKDVVFLLERREENLKLSHREGDADYARSVLYEALHEFDSTIREVENVVKPEHLISLTRKRGDAREPRENDPKQLPADLAANIRPEHILADIAEVGKDNIIKELLAALDKTGAVPNFDAAFSALLAREKTLTTGIGDGIALPHAKIPGITDIVAALGVKKEGLDFDSMDGKPVNIVVLILSPESKPRPHIQFMATISRFLNNPETRKKILDAETAADIHSLIPSKKGWRKGRPNGTSSQDRAR